MRSVLGLRRCHGSRAQGGAGPGADDVVPRFGGGEEVRVTVVAMRFMGSEGEGITLALGKGRKGRTEEGISVR
jgi:hypothetical protein